MKVLRNRVAVVVLCLAGALQANANACTSAATNLVAGADYSSCVDGDVSGETCTPICADGYRTVAAAAGFIMNCAGDGSFFGADTSLICEGERSFGAWEHVRPRSLRMTQARACDPSSPSADTEILL